MLVGLEESQAEKQSLMWPSSKQEGWVGGPVLEGERYFSFSDLRAGKEHG